MIIYNPIDKLAVDIPVKLRPRTAFIMTKLGEGRSEFIERAYNHVKLLLESVEYSCIDATTITTGKDYLKKIIDIIASVPMGILIIDSNLSSKTLSNIFYEMGWLDALGKETLIIKSPKTEIPSDLTRTEYIEYNENFESNFNKYVSNLFEQAAWYSELASLIENNPLLAIDYYRRGFLLTNDAKYIEDAKAIIENDTNNLRAKNSVENLLSYFTHK